MSSIFTHDFLFDFIKHAGTYLIMPNTYMNRSGIALAEAQNRWKINDVLAVYDDIELPLGFIRIRSGGGDGGHNGMGSLLEYATDEIRRIRIGIGRNDSSARDYVLDTFSSEEEKLMKPALDQVCKLLDVYVNSDFNAMLDEYSKHKQSYSGVTHSGIICPKEDK